MDFRSKKDFVVLLKAKVIKNIDSKQSDNGRIYTRDELSVSDG